MIINNINNIRNRFRGFYPVIIDIETAGFDPNNNPLLEIAAITIKMNKYGWISIDNIIHFHIKPFSGSFLKKEALEFNKIDPNNPLRGAVKEITAISKIFKIINKELKNQLCNKAIVVAHNASFDHSFLMAAITRVNIKNNPFHPFTMFDTATLSGILLGQTVLSKACIVAGINFNNSEAHSALYDALRTAELFSELVNKWKKFGGWPISFFSKNKKNK
ncbi:ribonuclease T [Sodalis-like secondary symbiont of Drepanosiphum platanoidis]|uniref:ribonuclease T n=1 Tax=Sodalis-like secondary symbiont of Drepanosiphum platanoidis TaxID=2994493 RepID=UPI0034649BE8